MGLDPWISWPTLHRDVIDEQHQIFHLGQSLNHANRSYPPLWELLARREIKVGIMGSLPSSAVPANAANYAFYVPDFFAHETFAYPDELEAFQRLKFATRKSARNVDRGIPVKEGVDFLSVRHGVGHRPSSDLGIDYRGAQTTFEMSTTVDVYSAPL